MSCEEERWLTEEMIEELPRDDQDDLNYYLHGHCDEWVAAHFEEGDKAVAWIEWVEDEDTGEPVPHLLHCWLEREGHYLDVRGATGNYDDVEEGFDCWGDEVDYMEFTDIEQFKTCISDICGFGEDHWEESDKEREERQRGNEHDFE